MSPATGTTVRLTPSPDAGGERQSSLPDGAPSGRCFRRLVETIHAMTGVTIQEERQAMLDFRLRRRLRALDLEGYDAYLELLAGSPDEQQLFIEQVTTHETYFYRTPRVWEYLENEYLPAWRQRHPTRSLRAWSAASSTGEEARTIAILCSDCAPGPAPLDFQVLGTDISGPTVTAAREGLYREKAVQRFRQDRPDLYQRYIVGDAQSGYRTVPAIEQRLRFEVHNLFACPRDTAGFDLVLLRNVLIYFTPADQVRVMAIIKTLLNPGGVLIIGESESLNGIDAELEYVSPTIYRAPDVTD